MVAMQSRALAKMGYNVLLFDLFGTGDSSGEFAEATWSIWQQNIQTVVDWLTQQNITTIDLWGLRTGNLLAMEYASGSQQKIGRLLCWQPVLNGDVFVTQFLRLRVAAAMMDNQAPREKISDLKAKLLAGQSLEVAGYGLTKYLLEPLMNMKADQVQLPSGLEIAIIEVVANPETGVGTSYNQFIKQLKDKNISTTMTKAVGELFWASQEIGFAPDLIDSTNKILENRP